MIWSFNTTNSEGSVETYVCTISKWIHLDCSQNPDYSTQEWNHDFTF